MCVCVCVCVCARACMCRSSRTVKGSDTENHFLSHHLLALFYTVSGKLSKLQGHSHILLTRIQLLQKVICVGLQRSRLPVLINILAHHLDPMSTDARLAAGQQQQATECIG